MSHVNFIASFFDSVFLILLIDYPHISDVFLSPVSAVRWRYPASQSAGASVTSPHNLTSSAPAAVPQDRVRRYAAAQLRAVGARLVGGAAVPHHPGPDRPLVRRLRAADLRRRLLRLPQAGPRTPGQC